MRGGGAGEEEGEELLTVPTWEESLEGACLPAVRSPRVASFITPHPPPS